MNAPISPPQLMTTEEFLALPDDGVERWLIDGQLRERRPGSKEMTYRNHIHSAVEANVVYVLKHWLRQQPKPRGKVYSGEAGCCLRHDPDTVVGIDVVYATAEVLQDQPEDATLLDVVPTLVVEILSPSNTIEEIDEKRSKYLAAGVALIWIVDPYVQTVTVYGAGRKPLLFNIDQELSADPDLPGFKVAVQAIFED